MTLRVASEPFLTEAQVRRSDCACIGANSPSQDVVEDLIDEASDIIAIVTGQFIAGRQSVIARPCATGMVSCDPCPCCELDAIPLGDADTRPVITEVLVDGEALDEDYFWLHWNRVQWMLARRPNPNLNELRPPHWPTWQKRYLAITEEDTFAIRLTQGIHVDDAHVIQAAALEIVCDLANDDSVRANAIEGAVAVSAGGANVVLDRNQGRATDDSRLARIANGELGPMCRRMMGIYAPGGRSHNMVWAPELTFGWELNLEIDPNPPT
jgi:hypothetical protein